MKTLLFILTLTFSYPSFAWLNNSNIDEITNQVIEQKLKEDKSLYVRSNTEGAVILDRKQKQHTLGCIK